MTHNRIDVPNRDKNEPERREQRRQRMLKGARLLFNRGQSVAEAVVRDSSEAGVRLRLGETIGIPSDCTLIVSGSDDARPAHVVWRDRTDLGISFA